MSSEPSNADPPFGRSEELAELERALELASRGVAQLVFVSGEAGLGKSTLVRRFLAGLAGRVDSVGVGQCVEQYGPAEPYLPLLEAVAQLCRGRAGVFWREMLWRLAPSWLAQLPGLVDDDEWEMLERRTRTTTSGRMLREIAESFEHGALHSPLVVVLEDLHWSDEASFEALKYLSRQGNLGRVLLVATCRPEGDARSEALASFRREVCARGRASELVLGPLTAEAILELFRSRAHPRPVDQALASAVFERSKGNPLFASHVIEHALGSHRTVLLLRPRSAARYELALASCLHDSLIFAVGPRRERSFPDWLRLGYETSDPMRGPAHQLSEIIGFMVMVSREQGRQVMAPEGENDEHQPPARLAQSDRERFRTQSGTASNRRGVSR